VNFPLQNVFDLPLSFVKTTFYKNMSALYDAILSFFAAASPAHITAISVIDAAMKEERWARKEEVKEALQRAISDCEASYAAESDKHTRIMGLCWNEKVSIDVNYQIYFS
jgi:hypothetical protein